MSVGHSWLAGHTVEGLGFEGLGFGNRVRRCLEQPSSANLGLLVFGPQQF